MVYAVSPSGQVFEFLNCYYWKRVGNYTEIWTAEDATLMEILPEGWWCSYRPPHPRMNRTMTSQEIIHFIRDLRPYHLLADVKRELKNFNAKTLTWEK